MSLNIRVPGVFSMKPLFWLVAAIVFSAFIVGASASQAVIYKNEACGHCGPYLERLLPALKAAGITDVVEKDFVNDVNVRSELAKLQESFNVPLTMQGHMLTIIDGKYLLEGHIPVDKVSSFLKNPPAGRLVVYLDSMTGEALPYSVLTEDGQVKQCAADQEIQACASSSSSEGSGSIPSAASGGIIFPPWFAAALVVLVPLGLIIKFG